MDFTKTVGIGSYSAAGLLLILCAFSHISGSTAQIQLDAFKDLTTKEQPRRDANARNPAPFWRSRGHPIFFRLPLEAVYPFSGLPVPAAFSSKEKDITKKGSRLRSLKLFPDSDPRLNLIKRRRRRGALLPPCSTPRKRGKWFGPSGGKRSCNRKQNERIGRMQKKKKGGGGGGAPPAAPTDTATTAAPVPAAAPPP